MKLGIIVAALVGLQSSAYAETSILPLHCQIHYDGKLIEDFMSTTEVGINFYKRDLEIDGDRIMTQLIVEPSGLFSFIFGRHKKFTLISQGFLKFHKNDQDNLLYTRGEYINEAGRMKVVSASCEM